MPHLRLVERQFAAFLRTPLSVRKAMAVIVTATFVSVLAGGVAIRLVDEEEFPNVGIGLWWALQTVTTVGYGDVVPENGVGRLVGALFMLESIAFIAIVTAAITSSFVEKARRERAPSEVDQSVATEHLEARLTEITVALERIERRCSAVPPERHPARPADSGVPRPGSVRLGVATVVLSVR